MLTNAMRGHAASSGSQRRRACPRVSGGRTYDRNRPDPSHLPAHYETGRPHMSPGLRRECEGRICRLHVHARFLHMLSAVSVRDPRDAAKADPLIREFARLLFAGLAVDAVRIDFAIVDAPGFFGEALADVIAVGLDLPPHFEQRRAKLRR